MDYRLIEPTELDGNAIDLIANEWMLVTAGDNGRYNTMTASWGALGEMWSRHVAQIVLRPTRFTKEFVDTKTHFTLCFFGQDAESKAIHKVCGNQSGRDVDKAALTGLTPVYDEELDTVYFEGARVVVVCKKLYACPFDPACFIEKDCLSTYANQDYHTQYFGEIVKVMIGD